MVQLSPQVIENILQRLHKTSTPRFGNMKPQQMVEHLTEMFSISKGSVSVNIYTPVEKLSKWKAFLMSDLPFQPYKSPIHENGLPELQQSNLTDAKTELIDSVETFRSFYMDNPAATNPNPMFGDLNYAEWERFHRKHLMHHFKQFKLIQ